MPCSGSLPSNMPFFIGSFGASLPGHPLEYGDSALPPETLPKEAVPCHGLELWWALESQIWVGFHSGPDLWTERVPRTPFCSLLGEAKPIPDPLGVRKYLGSPGLTCTSWAWLGLGMSWLRLYLPVLGRQTWEKRKGRRSMR